MKKGKLRVAQGNMFLFYCPACKEYHGLNNSWSFNCDYDKPTFSPSILVTWGDKRRCHSFVRDGKIQYLSDCTHDLAGQIIEMVDEEL